MLLTYFLIILQCAEYCIDYKWTLSEIADNMMMPKSTVHKYLTHDLAWVSDEKFQQVKRILRERRN